MPHSPHVHSICCINVSVLVFQVDGSARFVHTVDSRVPLDPLSVYDEGLFNKLENGDDLETGTMINPDTGELMSYEEVWRTLPVVEGHKGFMLLESMGDRDKCFVGRIGKWFQGIGTREGVVSAVRQELVDGKEWEVKFLKGDADVVPLFNEEEGGSWKIGDQVEVGGRMWQVLDCEM
jgi:hypothetical protein